MFLAVFFKRKCRPENQRTDQSQESPEIVPQNSIENRNCFFSIDSSSNSEIFDDDDNLNVQTPIIRQPRLRGPNIRQ